MVEEVELAERLPEDYIEIASWELGQTSPRRAMAIAGLTLAAFFVALFVAVAIVTMTTGMETLNTDLTNIPVMVVGLVLILVIHELTHAVAFRTYGVRPKFRLRRRAKIGTVFYVSAPGSYLRRDEYLAVGLAPLVLLTLILLAAAVLISPGSVFTTTALAAVALAAAVDDLFIACEVFAYPGETYFEDIGYGFTAYGRART